MAKFVWSRIEEAYWNRLFSEWDQASRDLSEAIRYIDPAAVDLDGFWMTFVADVQMGNFATKDILDEPDK